VTFAFGDHELDIERRELRRGGAPVAIEPQVFDLLVHLIRNRERVVTKDDLIETIWGGRIVSESAVTTRLNSARKAIGDNGQAQRLIRTVPRRGVRFVGAVTETAAPAAFAECTVPPLEAAPLVLPDKPSIAVLPFANLSGDPEQGFLADGMVEDLVTCLSRLRWLFVISRSSTSAYKGRTVDTREVARDLGVRYLLQGSVRQAGDRLRVTAQLIEAENGRQVWAERYDRGIKDIFALQDEITDTIAATLEPEISAAERDRARRKPPGSLGAWELYQRGMWHMLRRNREDFTAARTLFRDAIRLDPAFATAHAAYAISAFWQITHGFAIDAAAMRAELLTSASLAIECDERDFLAHSATGLAFMETIQHTKALAEHEIATALNPNSAFAQWCFGYALNRADRPREALERFDLALRLSPRDPAAWSFQTLRASALYLLGRYDEAIAAARDATRTQLADVVWPLVHLAASLGRIGRSDEALAAIAELRRRRPGLTIAEFRAWPHNESRSAEALDAITNGLRAAGLPEAAFASSHASREETSVVDDASNA
jgi:TolB-like protein/tetratricopeptide (TPR) repeat protein